MGPSHTGGRGQVGARQSLKEANGIPEMASSTKLQAGFQFLTKKSWDSRWLTSAERVSARDQLPRRDTGYTVDECTRYHLVIQVAGTGEVIRRTCHLRRVRLPATGRLSCLDLGRAQNAGPTESAPLWRTQEAEPEWLRHGKCMKPRACSLQSNLEPEQCRLGKHTCHEWEQTQCG